MKRPHESSTTVITSPQQRKVIEQLEQTHLEEGGSLFVNDEAIKPLPVATGRASMPGQARERLREAGALLIPATELARKAGTTKAANVVLLGALSQALGFSADVWERIIAARVPEKYLDVNLEAFKLGASFFAE